MGGSGLPTPDSQVRLVSTCTRVNDGQINSVCFTELTETGIPLAIAACKRISESMLVRPTNSLLPLTGSWTYCVDENLNPITFSLKCPLLTTPPLSLPTPPSPAWAQAGLPRMFNPDSVNPAAIETFLWFDPDYGQINSDRTNPEHLVTAVLRLPYTIPNSTWISRLTTVCTH